MTKRRNKKIRTVKTAFKGLALSAFFVATLGMAGFVDNDGIVKTGTYHDYMVVTINDGTEYLLNEDDYTQNGKAIFEEGQSVTVMIDCNGTGTPEDDKILNIIGR